MLAVMICAERSYPASQHLCRMCTELRVVPGAEDGEVTKATVPSLQALLSKQTENQN